MNAVIIIQKPFPSIESVRFYKRFRGELNSWIYPINLNGVRSNIRVKNNAMWVDKALATKYSDDVWNFIGNVIATKRLI